MSRQKRDLRLEKALLRGGANDSARRWQLLARPLCPPAGPHVQLQRRSRWLLHWLVPCEAGKSPRLHPKGEATSRATAGDLSKS